MVKESDTSTGVWFRWKGEPADTMRQLLTSTIAGLTAVIATALATGAANANEVIIILDGSGSSAGQIGGVAKIDIARGALRSVLSDAPDDLSIGLVAYGHRQEGACSDVELIRLPGPPDGFADAADGVRSLGRSPIAEATALAASAVSDPDAATIIVITDNADNCSPDPCATVSAIHDEMPGLTISVLGIAVPDNEVAEISCFADLTGGLYLLADDSASFQANLDEAFSAALVDPLPPLPNASIVLPSSVVQGLPFLVEYRGPLADGDEIRIAWLGSPAGHHIAGGQVPGDGGPVALTAPAEIGAFELRYWHDEREAVLARVPLRVEPLAPYLEAPETVQQGGTITVDWHADQAGGRTIQIADPTAPVGQALVTATVIRGEETVVLPAPADVGTYEIRLVDAPPTVVDPAGVDGKETRVLARRIVTVGPAEIEFTIDAPILAGTEFQVNWQGPGGVQDEIRIAGIDADDETFIATAPARGESVTLDAPAAPGTFELRYYSAVLGGIIATEHIEISMPAATLDAPEMVMGGGPFEVRWTGPGAPGDRIVVQLSEDPGAAVLFERRVPIFGDPIVFDAPVIPGTYSIGYIGANGALTLAQRPFDVTEPIVEIRAPGTTEIGSRIEIEWSGPGGRYDEIRLVGPGPNMSVVTAVRLQPAEAAVLTAPDEPGIYRIIYWSGGARIDLAATSIEIGCAACDDAPAADAELRLAP